MVDLHCHVLPGIDDGALDLSESVRMCRIAQEEGFKVIVATPHCCSDVDPTAADTVLEAVSLLNAELKDKELPLHVAPGMEVRVFPELVQWLAEKRILTLNAGRYVLLELPSSIIPNGFENLVDQLISGGYGVVLSHPEKNLWIQERPQNVLDLLGYWDQWDFLTQISADSLTGQAGRPAYKTAKLLLERGAAHILATDAHSDVVRPPRIRKALGVVTKIAGDAQARAMVLDTPRAVLTGTGFPRVEHPRTKKWWRLFT